MIFQEDLSRSAMRGGVLALVFGRVHLVAIGTCARTTAERVALPSVETPTDDSAASTLAADVLRLTGSLKTDILMDLPA
jgi:hypothetical protein